MQEVTRWLQVVWAGVRKIERLDLEAVEMLARGSMHCAGAHLLGRLLSESSPQPCTIRAAVATPLAITTPGADNY